MLHTASMLQRLHVFTHVREKAPRGLLTHTSVKRPVQSGADGWHMWPEFPACTMTQEFTLGFHWALPSTAALLTRAQRFNYWPAPALKLHQLSHTGNCLSQCKGGNWMAGLWGKMYSHCSSEHLIMLWIVGRLHDGELEAYVSSTEYRFYKKKFLIEFFFLFYCDSVSAFFTRQSGKACNHWGNERDTFGRFYSTAASTGEFQALFSGPSVSLQPFSLAAWSRGSLQRSGSVSCHSFTP